MPNTTGQSALSGAAVFMLAGGKGRRLRPLTNDCPKPLVPFGGGYRIIDFALSNALHSQADHVFVATQYEAGQVSRYLHERWGTVGKRYTFAIPLAPPFGRRYRGTCDALFHNLHLAEREGARDAIVLSADQIYQMDYRELLAFHRDQNADATIATTTVDPASASQYGVVRLGSDGRITDFWEKPADVGLWPDPPFPSVINMGVYVFRIDLLRSLIGPFDTDFGRHLLPRLVRQARTVAYRFDLTRPAEAAFWTDVGTIESYFEAHRAFLRGSFSPVNADWPVRGGLSSGQLAPLKKEWENSFVAPTAMVKTPDVRNSVIGPEAFVGPESSVHDSILMPRARLGSDVHVRHAIVASGAHVPDRSSIGLRVCSKGGGRGVSGERIAVFDTRPTDAQARESHSWRRGLILLADGDADTREWTRETLESEGYFVLVVAGAIRFMELMVEYRAKVQLVICGPSLDGHTANEFVRLMRDNLGRNVPIAVRIEEGVPFAPDAVMYRPDALLTLPRSVTQLIGTVDELVQRWSDAAAGRALEHSVSSR